MPLPVDIQTDASTPPSVPDSPNLAAALLKRKRRKRNLTLDRQQKRDLVVRILMDFQDAYAGNTAFRENHVEFMDNWRGTPTPNDEGILGDQSANIKVPLTSTYIEQWKARLTKVIFPDDQVVKFHSLNDSLEAEHLKDISDWFNWELVNIVKLPEKLNAILHYVLVDGFALPFPVYEREIKPLFVTKEYELAVDVPLPLQIDRGIRQAFEAMGNAVKEIEPTDKEGVYNVDVKEVEKLAIVTVLLEEDTLVLEIEYEATVFDGVKVEIPNIEDIVIMNTDPDPEKLPFLGLRTWMSMNDFWEAFDRGKFEIDLTEAETVAAMAASKSETYIPHEITDESDIIEGGDSVGQPFLRGNADERLWIEIYRWEGQILLPNNDRVGVAVWVSPRSWTILRMERLENLNKDAKRSCVKQDFLPVPGRFYSIGLSEWLRHVQTEMDGIHNFRLNSALVATVPFGFYEPAAGMPHTIIGLRAGQLYPVKRAEGVKFPNINWNPIWGFQEEGLVRKYASELAGMGDVGVGTYTSKRTSATEFAGTAQALDIRTEYVARIVLRGIEELLYRVFGLYQQFAKGQRIFYVSGSDGVDLVKSLEMDRLDGRLRLQLVGDVKTLSAALERQVAIEMMSILLQPLLIQMGIVKPDTIYAAIEKVIKTSEYKGVPIHRPDIPPDSPAPMEEMEMMNAGIYTPPHAGEDFGAHLQAHTMTASRQDLVNLASPVGIQLLQRHIMETVQLQQQVMIQRQMQAVQAMQMQAEMQKYGIRPGQAGTAEAESQPASPAERNNGGGGDNQTQQTVQ